MIYLCRPCNAYVGVHKGTNQALGRLANAELRELKKQAHKHFDPIWQKELNEGYKVKHARKMAYLWLSKGMNLSVEETHIGMFDVDQCRLAIELCKNY